MPVFFGTSRVQVPGAKMVAPDAQSLLPNELQEVEYLESSGTQYIDTGVDIYNVVASWKTSIDFQLTSLTFKKSWATVGGTGYWGGNYEFYTNFPYVGGGTFSFEHGAGSNPTKFGSINTNRHQAFVDVPNRTVIFDGQTASYSPNTNKVQHSTVYLFASHKFSGGTYDTEVSCKIFSSSMYGGASQIRNFVPCCVKTGKTYTDRKGNVCQAGKPGLYDTVNGVFYTNDGTGEFTVGPDV